MKKIILFICCVFLCLGFAACEEKKSKETLVVSVDLVDSDGNLINDMLVTLNRHETYTVNAICKDIDGNEVALKEKNIQMISWRCSDPSGVTFSPAFPTTGKTGTLYGSTAPISPTVTVDYRGIIAKFSLKIVMPMPD